jgi:hypothetical protein
MKKNLFILFIVSTSSGLMAQEEKDVSYFLKNTYINGAVGFGAKQFAGNLSWEKLHGLGKKKNLKIGYGIRFNTYSGSDQKYLTAPAKITGASDFNNSYDTVSFKKAQSNSINLALFFQYTLFKKLDLGFNIDAVGFSFGSNQVGDYTSSKYKPVDMPNIIKYQTTTGAKPTSLNALLVGDNDLGMLSSEFMARYWITEKLAVKLGFNYLFTEFTTDKMLRGGTNDRYRNKSALFEVGVSFKIK